MFHKFLQIIKVTDVGTLKHFKTFYLAKLDFKVLFSYSSC